MKHLFLIIVAVISATTFTNCRRTTVEENFQRQLEYVSMPLYVDEERAEAVEIISVMPIQESSLVRVIVKRLSDGDVLAAIGAKCSDLQPGSHRWYVLVSLGYKQTAGYQNELFYIKE